MLITKEELTSLILERYTIKQLQDHYNCSRSKITDTKRKYGLVGLSPNNRKRDNGDGTKTCKSCNITKSLSEFYSNGYYNGNKKYKSDCITCSNGNSYTTFTEKVEDILQELGKEYKCEKCGFDKHPAALQFHHFSEEKNFNISDKRNSTREILLNEILLCDVLCANCHAIEHYEESRRSKD